MAVSERFAILALEWCLNRFHFKDPVLTEYKKKLEALTRSLAGWDCLSRSRNPVLNVLRSPGAELEMVEAVRQYCFLPATIVEYLTIGLQRLAGWSAAAEELKRNRAEE